MNETATSLFTEDPAAQDANAVVPARPLFVTNRYNLLEFLSAGLIVPSLGIGKYYADLLEIRPGRIPLLRGPIHESVTSLVSAEAASALPVALELDPSKLEDSECAALVNGGTARLSDAGAMLWAPTGVLSLAAVSCVHFRNQAEMDEHTARSYENVPDSVPMMVSPELFSGGNLAADEIRTFLETLPEVKASPAPALDHADRIAGARALALFAAPANTTLLKQLLRAVVLSTRSKKELGKGPLPSSIIAALSDVDPSPDATAGDALFRASVEILQHVDRADSWRPLEVLRSIEQEVDAMGLPEVELDEVHKNLRPIGAMLRNERDFKPFAAGTGLDAAKALLLVLLRPDPARLLSWPRAETGADDCVTVLSASLCGLVQGHKKLSLDLRNDALDSFLAMRLAKNVTASDSGALSPAKSSSTIDAKTLIDKATKNETVVIKLGREVLLSKEVQRRRLVDILASADLNDPSVRSVAIDLCRMASLDDCLISVVRSRAFEILAEGSDNEVVFSFQGSVEIEHQLDEQGLLSALKGGVDLPPKIEAELSSRLAS
jgi:hypothetical protein